MWVYQEHLARSMLLRLITTVPIFYGLVFIPLRAIRPQEGCNIPPESFLRTIDQELPWRQCPMHHKGLLDLTIIHQVDFLLTKLCSVSHLQQFDLIVIECRILPYWVLAEAFEAVMWVMKE